MGGRWAQDRFWDGKMEPNGPTWSQHDIKREAKMEPVAPKLFFHVEKVSQKAIPKTKKMIFGKGRHQDGYRNSKYSAQIALFLDLY